MCQLEGEPYELWKEKTVVARLDHRCSCCGGPIKKGEIYVVHFSKFEGEIERAKLCPACMADRAVFMQEPGHDVTPSPRGFVSTLQECVSDDEPDHADHRWMAMIARIRQTRKENTIASPGRR